MKFLQLYLFVFAILLFCGCHDDESEITPVITPLNLTAYPADETFLLLNPAGTDSLKIYWEKSQSNDGTQVLYSVQFDKVDGDFSQPVGTVVTDSIGLSKRARILHKTLNILAEDAGIEPLGKGKLKWRIRASNGIASSYSDAHIIEVERPVGIAEIPNTIYLTGDATEGGADALKGIIMKKLSVGVFEIYASLTAGSYKFSNSITTSPVVSFYPDGVTIKKRGSAESPAQTKKPYHIYLDFNTGQAVISEIVSLGLWHGGSNTVVHELEYQKSGTWLASNITPFATGLDDRYKFKMVKKASDGSLSDTYLGSSAITSSRPTSTTAASYYNLVSRTAFSQYDYSFKFSTASENKTVDINLILTSSTTYTHKFTIK